MDPQAGLFDQKITWLSPPDGGPTDDFSDDPPPPPLWTEVGSVMAGVKHVATPRTAVTGQGKSQEVYEITLRNYPVSKNFVARWAQPDGSDIYLAVQSIVPAQRSSTLKVMAVQQANPDVASGAEECD